MSRLDRRTWHDRPMSRVSFGPNHDSAFEAWRDGLVEEFGRWSAPFGLSTDPNDLGLLLDWKRGYGDGLFDRWTRVDEKRFLLEWCPRHLSATADEAHGLPATIALAMSFLTTRELLGAGSDPVEGLTEYALELAPRFRRDMDDPSKFGMAKTLFGNLGLDPDQLGDPAALQEAIEGFNALPQDERLRVTGGPGAAHRSGTAVEPPARVLGPVLLPDPDRVSASAAAAPVLARFDALADYFAPPGKVLTKAGNLRLVDARALVELLETGETFEQQIGDRTFKTNSASELPDLDHWQWWARESGVIRKQHDRLIAVKAWRRRRTADPVEAVREAFSVLLDHGALLSYWTWMRTQTVQFVDACTAPLIARLLDGSERLDDIVDLLGELRAEAGLRELYPGDLSRTVERLILVLERAGVLEHLEYDLIEEESGNPRRVGGLLSLTPLGVVVGVDLAEESGLTVDVLADPATSAAEQIVGQVETLGPEQWWQLAGEWLAAQPEIDPAVEQLVRGLGELGAHWPLLVLDAAPQAMQAKLEPTMRTLAARRPTTEQTALGVHWMVTHGLRPDDLGADDLDQDAVLDTLLINLGIMVEADPDQVEKALDADTGSAGAYDIIEATLERMPPRGELLLEAIGAHHRDKGVAKAARKALFRFRSKLVARTQQPSG